MAQRYLRATGNWNSPVWAATSGGAAGSAATPTPEDDVYISANYTVTLTANAACAYLSHTNGTLSLSSYTLTTGFFSSGGNTARTLNLGSGTLIVGPGDFGMFDIFGSNLTLNAGTSLVKLRPQYSGGETFSTLNKSFNDVVIEMGSWGSSTTSLDIIGSPTFRSLIIQSKNSAAHTVNFSNGEDASQISLGKFVAIGSSPSNRLTLTSDFMASISPSRSGATVYGQNIHLERVYADGWVNGEDGPTYIGSNSTTDYADGWILQDPPKISTLVDPLTIAPGSNSNWTVTGTVTQTTSGIGGGGYFINDESNITSSGAYDITEGQTIFEMATRDGVGFFIDDTITSSGGAITGSMDIFINLFGRTLSPIFTDTLDTKFIRVNLIGVNLSIDTSEDGVTFSSGGSITLSPEELLLFKSVRVKVANTETFMGAPGIIGSINMLPAPTNTAGFLPFFIP